MLKIIRSDDRRAVGSLLSSRMANLSDAETVARRIIDNVRRHGDQALIRYSRQFDGIDLRKTGMTVTHEELDRVASQAPPSLAAALSAAAKNIRAVARRQLPRAWQVQPLPGVHVSQVLRPLERVACYVPGGRFPLPSTVLMSVIPAQVAGVREILVTSPKPAPVVMLAASMLGVTGIYRLGGAQAVAAFAYGTETVPRVEKIVGPGNRYVAAAKKLVAGECGIDFVAGPSELVVVGADGNPWWIAADLVAQAEHDPDAVAILITPSLQLARRVQARAAQLVAQLGLPVARKSLADQGCIVLTRTLAEAAEFVNRLAPEHLTLLEDAEDLLHQIQSAGSIFLGGYSPVAAGDYASGTNHILPTAGAARVRGGLSAADFIKCISVQKITRDGLSRLRPSIVTLAGAEGLTAHAESVQTRFQDSRPSLRMGKA
ncbi:bifunctional histidinal dehydrogenase and histidinol dehydrogenase [Acidobacteriia bacterium SbA2]|nr:bifunctional histidinal dehydrogenase and histidinol dehydrogenase [Acidobacteriia bacterium SbA2]